MVLGKLTTYQVLYGLIELIETSYTQPFSSFITPGEKLKKKNDCFKAHLKALFILYFRHNFSYNDVEFRCPVELVHACPETLGHLQYTGALVVYRFVQLLTPVDHFHQFCSYLSGWKIMIFGQFCDCALLA